MLGNIFEIKRFAVHDGPGVRTTIFFKGCPLRCLWCHNPEGIDFAKELAYFPRLCAACGDCVSACPAGLHAIGGGGHTLRRDGCALCMRCVGACMPGALKCYGKQYGVDELIDVALKDGDFYASSGGGVTCSGGEPLLQADFLSSFLSECKKHGIHTAIDTSGYTPWDAFEAVLPYADLFLYDIKHMNGQRHKELTGVSNKTILANLRTLSDRSAPVEVRLPVIPNLNDDDENVSLTASFLKEILTLTAVRPLPYHALSGSKYESIGKEAGMPPTFGDEGKRAEMVADRLSALGIPVIYPEVKPE